MFSGWCFSLFFCLNSLQFTLNIPNIKKWREIRGGGDVRGTYKVAHPASRSTNISLARTSSTLTENKLAMLGRRRAEGGVRGVREWAISINTHWCISPLEYEIYMSVFISFVEDWLPALTPWSDSLVRAPNGSAGGGLCLFSSKGSPHKS